MFATSDEMDCGSIIDDSDIDPDYHEDEDEQSTGRHPDFVIPLVCPRITIKAQ